MFKKILPIILVGFLAACANTQGTPSSMKMPCCEKCECCKDGQCANCCKDGQCSCCKDGMCKMCMKKAENGMSMPKEECAICAKAEREAMQKQREKERH